MNNYKGALNRWKSEDNPGSGMNVRANRVSKGQNGTTSTWHVEDGSYLRIKNISLGYTLPENWLKKVYLKSARVYCSIQIRLPLPTMKAIIRKFQIAVPLLPMAKTMVYTRWQEPLR